MNESDNRAVIVSALRTPIGKLNGCLSTLQSYELGACAIKGALEKCGLAATEVDEVIMGQVLTANQGQNPARHAAILAGVPYSVPALGVNQVCGSGIRSIIMATQAIKCGDSSIVVAGGQESMTNAPHALHMRNPVNFGNKELIDTLVSEGLTDCFNHCSMGVTAENVAKVRTVPREAQDSFAVKSQTKYRIAEELNAFDSEIVSVEVRGRKQTITVSKDEHPRPNSSMEEFNIIIMSSKSKKRTVSQAELRQMMNDMKKKRGNSTVPTKNVKTTPLSAEDIKNLQEKKLKLLKQKKKSVSFSNQVQKTEINKTKANKSTLKSNLSTAVPKKSSLKQKTENKNVEVKIEQSLPSGLPADFFDNGMKPPDAPEPPTQEPMETNKPQTTQVENKSAIPEGFFDNPTADAKVRGVETPADVMDKEWESFKKEIQREETQSEQIIEEVQEVSNIDRQIDEIDEQLRCLSRVEILNDRKDARKMVKKEKLLDFDTESDSSLDDELDINSFDWREKDAFIS